MESRGAKAEDTVHLLFHGYMAVEEVDFVSYIKRIEDNCQGNHSGTGSLTESKL